MITSSIGNNGKTALGGAYALILVEDGTPGEFAEARIGDDVLGVAPFYNAGSTYIPVPKAGTYSIYVLGNDTGKTAQVTTRNKTYTASY